MRPGRLCEGFEESGFSKLFLIPWKKWNGWSGIIKYVRKVVGRFRNPS